MVPPRLARKMAVLSVDPPAPWAPGQIAAGRAHRPGSRRLGGVEAPGASPATGASWPDRRKGWASPGRGPVLPLAVMGGIDPDSGGLTSSRGSSRSWGRGFGDRRLQSHSPPLGLVPRLLRGAPLAGVSRNRGLQTMHKRYLPPSRPRVGLSARVLLPTAGARSDWGGLRSLKAARS